MTERNSTTVQLTKHHGLGNDFLVTFDEALVLSGDSARAEFTRFVCDRTRGVGADGLIVGAPAEGYTQQMILHNADGSRAEISGNGIRCFAQALASRAGNLDDQLILTDAGPRRVTLRATDRADTVDVSVEMGAIEELDEPSGWAATGCHPERPTAHLSLGNPHSVVGVDDVSEVDLAAIGTTVPDVNLEIVAPTSTPNTIRMRVHERGVGITEACGSGAVASAAAAARWGLAVPVNSTVRVVMDGGTAEVILDEPTPGHAILVGPATFVADVMVSAVSSRATGETTGDSMQLDSTRE